MISFTRGLLFGLVYFLFRFPILSFFFFFILLVLHARIRQTTDEDDGRAKGVCIYMFIRKSVLVCVQRVYIYIHTHVGPGFRGPAVTRVAKREIELHFRDVCVIPSCTHTHATVGADGDEIPRTITTPPS